MELMETENWKPKIVNVDGTPWIQSKAVRCLGHHGLIKDPNTALPVIVGYNKITESYIAKGHCCSANCVKYVQLEECKKMRSKLLSIRLGLQQEVYRHLFKLQWETTPEDEAKHLTIFEVDGDSFCCRAIPNPFMTDSYVAGGMPMEVFERLYCKVKHYPNKMEVE